jgi:hypothetical protein
MPQQGSEPYTAIMEVEKSVATIAKQSCLNPYAHEFVPKTAATEQQHEQQHNPLGGPGRLPAVAEDVHGKKLNIFLV